MQGLAALCHAARKGGYFGSRSTYPWRASSPLDERFCLPAESSVISSAQDVVTIISEIQ